MAVVVKLGKHTFDLKSITVEPVMFMYMFVSFLQFITYQALLYDKVCSHNFNSTVCENLKNGTFKSEEDVIQKTTSRWLLYSNLSMGIPALLTVVLFIGPWGDKVGRKLPILSALIGALLASSCNLLNAVYMDAPLSYLLIGFVLNGLMGSYLAALMSMYSYIAHVSTPKIRTVKMGILEAMVFLSGTLGTSVSGVMLDRTSYVFVFGLLIGMMALTVIYTLVWVDNVKPVINSDPDTRRQSWFEAMVISSLKSVTMCVYEKRSSKNFLNLTLLISVLFFIMLVTIGENDIILIYTRHPPLEWSQTTLGLFKGSESFLRGIAVLTLLPLFKTVFSTRDTTLIIAGLLSKACGLLFIGLGRTTVVLFLGAVGGTLQGFGSAAVRSLCSSMVSVDEQAKLFSLIAMFESIASLAATSLFNTVYNATLDFYSGFCFLMAAAITFMVVVIAIVIHVRLGKDSGQTYGTLQDDTEDIIVDTDNTPELEVS